MIRTKLFKLASIAVLSVAVCEPVLAQPAASEGEITVTAPRTRERSPTSGAPIEIITTSRMVNYSDLDLRTGDGQIALEGRVKEAARKACEFLDRAYPLSTPDGADCAKTAVKEATPQVTAAVAAARAK